RGGRGELDGVELMAELVLGAAEDQRVEDEDVGHREEGGEAAAYLPAEGGTAFGDSEEAVRAPSRGWRGGGGAVGRAGGGRGGLSAGVGEAWRTVAGSCPSTEECGCPSCDGIRERRLPDRPARRVGPPHRDEPGGRGAGRRQRSGPGGGARPAGR